MSDYCKTRCACGWSYACANQHECDEALERHVARCQEVPAPIAIPVSQ